MLRLLFLFLFATALAHTAASQKVRKRPPKQENVQTQDDAIRKKAENKARMKEQYELKKKHHRELQDKGTRKRMKENYRKAHQLDRRGTTEPFYKRWFRRRHI